jgi:hypothetical protein
MYDTTTRKFNNADAKPGTGYYPSPDPFLPPILNIYVPKRTSLTLGTVLKLQIVEKNTGMLVVVRLGIIQIFNYKCSENLLK